MRTSYLDYAMSVIIGRAIPDVRDGLKPVHRRILYAMRDMNLPAGVAYKKCALVVGDVLGKYHPHGDASVYDALVRMAQLFSMRYPLIDGQGNFGSVDGDPPAAIPLHRGAPLAHRGGAPRRHRQGDRRLRPELTTTRTGSPRSCRRAFPNLLVNGSGGIAVGMATNIPPHNLGEVLDATVRLIRQPGSDDRGADRARARARLPDGRHHLRTARHRSGVPDRPRHHHDARPHDREKPVPGTEREQIVVTEIPYQVNKARLAREDRRAHPRQADRGHQRGARRERPRGHAPRHRAEEGRLPAGRP